MGGAKGAHRRRVSLKQAKGWATHVSTCVGCGDSCKGSSVSYPVSSGESITFQEICPKVCGDPSGQLQGNKSTFSHKPLVAYFYSHLSCVAQGLPFQTPS